MAVYYFFTCMIGMPHIVLNSCTCIGDTSKPGPWTLDWTMDWTVD